jgi:hypothetical protein
MTGDLKKQKKIYKFYSPFSRNVYPCLFFFLSNKNYVACTLSCRIKGINISVQAKNAYLRNGGRRGSLQS